MVFSNGWQTDHVSDTPLKFESFHNPVSVDLQIPVNNQFHPNLPELTKCNLSCESHQSP